jgi:hypothetical protein
MKLPIENGQLEIWVILKSQTNGLGSPGSSKIVAAFTGRWGPRKTAHAEAMEAIVVLRDKLENGESLHLIRAQIGGLVQVNSLFLKSDHKGSFA